MFGLGLALPIGWLVICIVSVYAGRGHSWRRLPVHVAWLVNLGAIWILLGRTDAMYFFICCGLACVTGILWALFTLLRVYDLLLGRFFRQYAFVLDVFTSLWWLLAVAICPR